MRLDVDDVVVPKFQDGHLLWIVTPDPSDRLSLMYRGNDWNVQYAVARGARLAGRRGGNLWYTSDKATTLEYLETFRRDPVVSRSWAEPPNPPSRVITPPDSSN